MSKNPKNWWKLFKIVNNDREGLHIFLTTWVISMTFSGKNMPYNNINTLFRRNIFGDGSNGRPLPQLPILLMVKTKTNSSFTVKVAERSNRSFSAELMNYLFQTSALFNMWQCNEQNLIDCIYDCVCLTKWYQYISLSL